MSTKTTKKVEYRVFLRFPSVIQPDPEKPDVRYVHAIAENGALENIRVSLDVFAAVLGNREAGEMGEGHEKGNLGIRNRSRASYGAHFENGICTGIDIIPSRYYQSGAMPTAAAEAVRQGFQVEWIDSQNGFDIVNDYNERGENLRIASIKATEADMVSLMRGLREVHGNKLKAGTTIGNFFVTKTSDTTYKVRPVKRADISNVPLGRR